jgi:hypothetical protein
VLLRVEKKIADVTHMHYTHGVWRCRLTVSKSELKACLVSALETELR